MDLVKRAALTRLAKELEKQHVKANALGEDTLALLINQAIEEANRLLEPEQDLGPPS